jgi:histone H3/H4
VSESEVLLVVSKLKKYIKEQSGMSTSGNVAPVLSDLIRKMCDQAIANAQSDRRKTVMDRDFSMPGGE